MTTYLTHSVRREPRFSDEQGVRIGLTHGALVLATVASALLGLDHERALLLLGATVLAGALVLTRGWALVLGASAWAFWTGFLDHRFGQLTLGATDLERLLVLVVIAVFCAELGRRHQHRG